MELVAIIILGVFGYFVFIVIMDKTVHKKSYEKEIFSNEKPVSIIQKESMRKKYHSFLQEIARNMDIKIISEAENTICVQSGIYVESLGDVVELIEKNEEIQILFKHKTFKDKYYKSWDVKLQFFIKNQEDSATFVNEEIYNFPDNYRYSQNIYGDY